MNNNTRESLNIVVVGHVDHGKSTLIGRLLYDTKSLSEGKIDKVRKISAEKGKDFEYAYLLDAFEEEQRQSITIDTTRLQFRTEKRDYVIIDAPGHKEFLKNMISGAASAEAAIIMLDVNEGVKEQSKRHGYMLSLLGIKNVYVAINKMDLVNYSEEAYNYVKTKYDAFLKSLDIEPIEYIPISAYEGVNITEHSEKTYWYNGRTIIEAIDYIKKSSHTEKQSTRLPVQDVYKFDHRRIIVGRLESGSIKVGDKISVYPEGKSTIVKSIENWQEKDRKNEAHAGECIGIMVEDEFFYRRGEIITEFEDEIEKSNRFRANIFWLGNNNLIKNKKYKLKLGTEEIECEIEDIIKVIDTSDLSQVRNKNIIKKNDVADVIIKTKREISYDLFSKNESTGRFVLVDEYDISGGGIISKSEESQEYNLNKNKYHDVIDRVYYAEENSTERIREIEEVALNNDLGFEIIRKTSDIESLVEQINSAIKLNCIVVVR